MTRVANIALAGVLAVGAVIASSATAAADPPPEVPADPVAPAPPPGPAPPPAAQPLAPLGQSGPAPSGPGGIPADLAIMGNPAVIGQNAVPSAPGGPAANIPDLGVNNQYLLAQNVERSAPGQGQLFDVPPGQENADLTGIDWLRRMHHMHQEGYLKGSLLGQMPQSQLGEPLPGTAPPPGTNLPAGLGQNLPEPPPPDVPPAPAPPPAG